MRRFAALLAQHSGPDMIIMFRVAENQKKAHHRTLRPLFRRCFAAFSLEL